MLDIIHILSGDDNLPPSFDSMRARVLEKQRAEFESIAWACHQGDAQKASRLVDLYQRMEPRDRARFLMSPDVFELVTEMRQVSSLEGIAELTKYCADGLAVAQQRPDRVDVREMIWTPMGDECLVRTAEGFSISKAARIGEAVVVDFDSPAALLIDLEAGCMCNPPEAYLASERELVLEKLRAALARIDSVAPAFGNMIRAFTSVIRVRKSDSVSAYGSEEVPSRPGEIRILNPQRADCDVNELAEILLHETTHCVLAIYEQVAGPFVLVPSDRRFRPVSPWSGNPIPVESFVHAVFVWYTLFQFALRELAMPGQSESEVQRIVRQLNRRASGFCIPSPLAALIERETAFKSGLLEVINKLQQIVVTLIDDMSSGRLEFLAPVAILETAR